MLEMTLDLEVGMRSAVLGCKSWPRAAAAALLVVIVGVAPAWAAGPTTLDLQGALTSAGGGPASDGTYALTFRLYDGDGPGAKQLWEEIQVAVAVKNAQFATSLGAKSVLPLANFAAGSPTWLGVTVGGDPELARAPLRAVPYALHAATADSAAGLQCSGCISSAMLSSGAVTGDKIAAGAVGANHVSFAWAGADGPGGSATFALAANTAKLADSAKTADNAAFADEAGAANTAKALLCTGCLTAAMFKDGALAKVATSGSYADLANKPVAVALGTNCADGMFVRGYDPDGKPVCGTDVAYGGKDFALSNQGCAVGSVVTGIDAAGKLLCGGTQLKNADKDPIVCGPSAYGYMYYNTASASVSVCTAQGFVPIMVTQQVGTQSNPASSCKAILAQQPAAKSGTYWLKPAAKAFEAYCDMVTGGGGWTMCYTTSGGVHVKTELTASAAYGKDGYRSDCNDIAFGEVLYVNHDNGQSTWFSRDAGTPAKLSATNYKTIGSDLGQWTVAGGVASAAYKYQLIVCDAGWMWTGLMMSGYTNCWKQCAEWCNDLQSPYFRVDGDDGSSYNGVAFNENGHQNVSTKTMSVGMR